MSDPSTKDIRLDPIEEHSEDICTATPTTERRRSVVESPHESPEENPWRERSPEYFGSSDHQSNQSSPMENKTLEEELEGQSVEEYDEDDYDDADTRRREAAALIRPPSRLGSIASIGSAFSESSSSGEEDIGQDALSDNETVIPKFRSDEDEEDTAGPSSAIANRHPDDYIAKDRVTHQRRLSARLMEGKHPDPDNLNDGTVSSSFERRRNSKADYLPKKRSMLGPDLVIDDLIVPDPEVKPEFKSGTLIKPQRNPDLGRLSEDFLRDMRTQYNYFNLELRQHGTPLEIPDPVYTNETTAGELLSSSFEEVARLRALEDDFRSRLSEERLRTAKSKNDLVNVEHELRETKRSERRLQESVSLLEDSEKKLNEALQQLDGSAATQIAELMFDNNELKQEISKSKDDQKDLKKQIEELSARLNITENEGNAMHDQVKGSPGCETCPRLLQELSQLKKENVEQEVSHVTPALPDETETAKGLRSALKDEQKRKRKLESAIAQLHQDCNHHELVIRRLKEAAKSHEERVQEAEKNEELVINEHSADLDKYLKDMESSEEQLHKLQQELEEVKKELSRAQDDLRTAVKHEQDKSIETRHELEKAKKELYQAKTNLQTATKQEQDESLKEAKSLLSSIERQLSEARSGEEVLRQELEARNRKHQDAVEEKSRITLMSDLTVPLTPSRTTRHSPEWPPQAGNRSPAMRRHRLRPKWREMQLRRRMEELDREIEEYMRRAYSKLDEDNRLISDYIFDYCGAYPFSGGEIWVNIYGKEKEKSGSRQG